MDRWQLAQFLVRHVAYRDDEIAVFLYLIDVAGPQAAQRQEVPFGGGDGDGASRMIISASMALLEAARNSAAKPALAIMSLVFGIGATLAMNVAARWHHGSAGALVAALPPVALVLSLETLMGLVRRSRERSVPSDPGQPLASAPHQVAMTAGDAVIMVYLHARDCVGDAPSQRQLAAQFGVSRARVAALVSPLSGTPTRPTASPARCRQKVQTGARTR